ncbi:MAG: voltage-gated potassium channel [Burkholderiales bacterium]|nr:voltage-gated potassium channel [Burkholderiales bacterium]
MALRRARDALSRIFYQRCFYMFAVLVVLITVVPFVPESDRGRMLVNWLNVFLVVAAVAAVGRTLMSFVIVLLLALPTVWFQRVGLIEDDAGLLAQSWMFGSALYFFTCVYLLRYVFRPEVMTADKLFGAAAAYLMLGVLWAYGYAIVGYLYPRSYLVAGQPGNLDYYEALYLSFTTLTSTGFGDIAPLSRPARGICMLEQIAGALFVAILIARLAGVYPPRRWEREEIR